MTHAQPVANTHAVLQASSARAVQVAESAPRASRVRFTVIVTGVGETRLDGKKLIEFGTLLLEEPTFSFGVQATHAIPKGQMPTATACVLKYAKTKSGFWTGAEMGFRVISSKANIQLKFSLTFEGSALRSTAGVDKALGLGGKSNAYKGEIS